MASVSGSESVSRIRALEEKNDALLDEIIELCQRSDRVSPEVIMLIGRSGSGKSALINTIHKVLTGRYFQLARQGRGNAQSVTLDLHRYENCGVSVETIKDEDRRVKIGAALENFPHIVDCAGLGDVDTPELREILELLIGGYIPPGTNISALEAKQEEFGVDCLKSKIFPNSKPEWRVTKVVFMQSCRDGIPKNLIDCLTGVLKIIDPATLRRKYTAEVFLLITKYDLVEEAKRDLQISDGDDKDRGTTNESMTIEEFEKVENDIAPEFNIVGALGSNRIRWVSYTDETGTSENPNVSNIALNFVRRMLQPGAPAQKHDQEPVMGPWTNVQLHLFKMVNQLRGIFLQDMQLNISPGLIVGVLVFVAVLYFFYRMLSATA